MGGIMTRRVLTLFFVGLLLALSAAIATAQEECVGEPECYEMPDPPDSRQEECVGEEECYELPLPSEPRPFEWPGDDRLNPAPDEYYSVYCNADVVDVWGGMPSPQEIGDIPLERILNGSFPFDGGNGLTVNRIGDTVTISGANGNGPFHPGSKSFSLEECGERNGGLPQREDTNVDEPEQQSDATNGEAQLCSGSLSPVAGIQVPYVGYMDETGSRCVPPPFALILASLLYLIAIIFTVPCAAIFYLPAGGILAWRVRHWRRRLSGR